MTAPAVQRNSDVSAKRSGASPVSGFEGSHFGHGPDVIADRSQTKARVLSSRAPYGFFQSTVSTVSASMSLQPRQFRERNGATLILPLPSSLLAATVGAPGRSHLPQRPGEPRHLVGQRDRDDP